MACQFRGTMGRMPRCREELDAYAESQDALTAYLLANPVDAETAKAAAAVLGAESERQAAEHDRMEAEYLALEAANNAKLAALEAAQAAVPTPTTDAGREALRAEAAKTLNDAGKAAAKGEREYRKGWMEAGRLADLYIQQRVGLGDKRQAAVKALDGRFSEVASDPVDVARLIGTWHAYRLLCLEQGLEKEAAAVAYGVYREAWKLVVERLDKDTPQERWVLLVGVEDACRAAFKSAVDGAISRQGCLDQARNLVGQSVRLALKAKEDADKAAKEVAAKAEAERLAARAATSKANEEAEAAAKAAADAAVAAAAAPEDETKTAAVAQAVVVADQAAEKLKAEQAAEKAAQDAAAKTKDAAAKAEKDAKAAALAQADIDAKEQARKDKAAQKAAEKTPVAECRAPKTVLPQRGQCGTVKDTVELVVGMVALHDSPDTVLEAVLEALAKHVEMTRMSHRACEAALAVLRKAEKTVPTVVAERMATVVPAATSAA